jgi:hypothetical protein
MKFTTKLAALVIGLSLGAAPAFALDGDSPGTTTEAIETTTTSSQPSGIPPVTTGQPTTIPPVTTGQPTTIPPGYGPTNNPGSSHLPPGQARALGRIECQEFKRNFADNKSQFGRCIADVAKAILTGISPVETCANLNRKRQEGERRSDFSACVAAAAQALRQSGA